MDTQTRDRSVVTEEPAESRSYRPNADVLESVDRFMLCIEMPGADRSGIQVDFEDGLLTIHGPVPKRTPENGRALLEEYGYGDYHRSFRLSEKIDANRISAEYDNGVLVLSLPKSEASMPRRIEVMQR
ncbi:MAG: Hsp20/alpha crystallin family protein [Planctomycetota bacterium]